LYGILKNKYVLRKVLKELLTRNFPIIMKLKLCPKQEIAKLAIALKIYLLNHPIKMGTHLFLCKTKAKLMHLKNKI
jgi:hypothetical protein